MTTDSTKKVFTKEHRDQLEKVSTNLLFANTYFSGIANSNYSVQNMMHDMSINTLKDMHSRLKDQVRKCEDSDEWTMTEHQEKKLKELQEKKEFLSLLIGYKIHQAQKSEAIKAKRELAVEIERLENEKMTPEERIQALKKELDSYSEFED
jgi:hypothetical protein